MTYRSSQAKGQIGAVAASLATATAMGYPAISVTYTTAHGNAGSLSQWARPGIKHASIRILAGFITTPGTPENYKYKYNQWCHCGELRVNFSICSLFTRNFTVEYYEPVFSG